jgi:hypothetical protein
MLVKNQMAVRISTPHQNEGCGDSGDDNINPFARPLQVTGKSFLQLSITQVKFPIIKSTQSFDLGIHNKSEVVHHGTHHYFDS